MKNTIIAAALLAASTSTFADNVAVKPADAKPATPVTAAPGNVGPAPAAKVAAASASSAYQVEVKSYRWRKHPRKNYERLVIEFNRKDKGGGPVPAPHVVPAASGKDATVVVSGVSLSGDTNEGKVSETYGTKSAFLSPLSILVDANNGFSVKLNFKKSDIVAEAMWLDSPSRLVIDVFASQGDRNAIRATAQDTADSDEKAAEAVKPAAKDNRVAEATPSREPVAEKKAVGTPNDAVASATETRSLFATTPAPTAKKSRRRAPKVAVAPTSAPAPLVSFHAPAAEPKNDVTSREDEFLCFPATSQVGLSVFFAPKNKHGDKEEVKLDIQNTQQKVATTSTIVCYPASSQVEASISFRDDKSVGKTDDRGVREPASKK